jgi:hypothetical protein
MRHAHGQSVKVIVDDGWAIGPIDFVVLVEDFRFELAVEVESFPGGLAIGPVKGAGLGESLEQETAIVAVTVEGRLQLTGQGMMEGVETIGGIEERDFANVALGLGLHAAAWKGGAEGRMPLEALGDVREGGRVRELIVHKGS